MDDSFFSDHCDESDYREEVLDPNRGLKNKVEIPTTVKRNKNLSIDDSPPSSSAKDSNEIQIPSEQSLDEFGEPKKFHEAYAEEQEENVFKK